MMKSNLFLMCLSLPVMVVAVAVASGQDDRDNAVHVVLPKDAILAILRPEFEPAARADRVMADDELMIGLVGRHKQRAYSTWQLDRHEIVNDTFEGRPVAVTW